MSRLPVCSGVQAVKAFGRIGSIVDHQSGRHVIPPPRGGASTDRAQSPGVGKKAPFLPEFWREISTASYLGVFATWREIFLSSVRLRLPRRPFAVSPCRGCSSAALYCVRIVFPSASKPETEPVEVKIDHRRGIERQELANQQTADNGDAQRPA